MKAENKKTKTKILSLNLENTWLEKQNIVLFGFMPTSIKYKIKIKRLGIKSKLHSNEFQYIKYSRTSRGITTEIPYLPAELKKSIIFDEKAKLELIIQPKSELTLTITYEIIATSPNP